MVVLTADFCCEMDFDPGYCIFVRGCESMHEAPEACHLGSRL